MRLAVRAEPLRPPAHLEIVERKGIGHPDTLADGLAEALSARLSREYLRRFGQILHHNVDKALLFGGASRPRFGGGEVVEPAEIYLSGRATLSVGGEVVPVRDLAQEVVETWVRRHLRFLDPARHLRVHCLVRPGSVELADLFGRSGQGRANDTSIGVGYAPLSPLERAALAIERHLDGPEVRERHPALGEDVKVMAVRTGDEVGFTVSVAMVDRFVRDVPDYEKWRARAVAAVREVVGAAPEVAVNAADDPAAGALYLTVTGTSLEAGDDGQVGRGNRVNGLITPLRPMSLEAAAGKNPVTHVGKLYNLLAKRAAEAIVELTEASAARVALVSRIGQPVREPWVADIRLAVAGAPSDRLRREAEDILRSELEQVEALTAALVDERIPVA